MTDDERRVLLRYYRKALRAADARNLELEATIATLRKQLAPKMSGGTINGITFTYPSSSGGYTLTGAPPEIVFYNPATGRNETIRTNGSATPPQGEPNGE